MKKELDDDNRYVLVMFVEKIGDIGFGKGLLGNT